LINRGLMTSFALLWLGMSYGLFSFTQGAVTSRHSKQKSLRASDKDLDQRKPERAVRRISPAWSKSTVLRQFLLRTQFEFKSIFFSLPFLLLMLISLAITF